MMDAASYIGQRRSYNGDLCTVRYIGTVEGTSGEWLGVEWDDPTRGKHSGQHQGVRYFTCKSKQPTAGSFVRPSRAADKPRGFLEALREKYASEFEEEHERQRLGLEDSLHRPIEISGKVVEEVGFDKIRRQLAELAELRIVLLDGMRVAGVLPCPVGLEKDELARGEIEQTSPKITELDLSRSLLTRWSEVFGICERLKRLRLLKLNGNRFAPVEEHLKFEGITGLHLDDTLLSWEELSALSYQFPSLTNLTASANQISMVSMPISNNITTLALEHNEISSLASVKLLTSLDKLEHLSLRGNAIHTVHDDNRVGEPIQFSKSLKSVDLSSNKINSWLFVNQLSDVFPGLQVLRVSGNPLYDQPVGPTAITGMPEKPMTVDESYMLTLARLSSLQVMNYGKITAKDRSDGELYYLSLIGKELSASPETAENDILAAHPRFKELCHIHGDPIINRVLESGGSGATVNPRSVAARLVRMAFHLPPSSSDETVLQAAEGIVHVKEIPRSFDTYQVKALVCRLFGLPPLEFKLIWETDELDPVSKENIDEEDGWDSEDDGASGDLTAQLKDDTRFVKREVELVDTTKDIGFWFQADVAEARVRIEVV